MMNRWCVLLRGINVGGVQVKMDALKTLFAELGYPGAQTILATGNVVIQAVPDTDRAALKTQLERALSERFAYDAHVLLRDRTEIASVLEAARMLSIPPETHLYVLFCDDAALPGELQALYDSMPHAPGEQFRPAAGEALWAVPKGSTLASDFGNKVLGSKKYKARLTSRNVNTVEKIARGLL